MKQGIYIGRVSSKEQIAGGSFDSQFRDGDWYAKNLEIKIVKEFEIAESASKDKRKVFDAAIEFAKSHREIEHILIAEVDRFSRNFWKANLARELVFKHHKQLHFFVSGYFLNANSDDNTWLRFAHEIVESTGFIYKLRSNTQRGLLTKARRGECPYRSPNGYVKGEGKTRKIHEPIALWIRRAFDLIRSREYTLESCRRKLLEEGCPKRIFPWKSKLANTIRNTFYKGYFRYKGVIYKGIHPAMISEEIWEEANAALSRLGKPFNRREHNYTSLMKCALCGCSITAENQKDHEYYHCTERRGKCGNKWRREEEIERLLSEVLTKVHLDPDVINWITDVLASQAGEIASQQLTESALLSRRLGELDRMESDSYDEKLQGKISEEFWRKKTNEWGEERMRIEGALARIKASSPATFLPTAKRTLELANALPQALFLMEPENRRTLMNLVCSNLYLDADSLRADYQIPFNLFAKMPQEQSWGG